MNTSASIKADPFLEALCKRSSEYWGENLGVQTILSAVDGWPIALAVSESGQEKCYLTSLTESYVSYPISVLCKGGSLPQRMLLVFLDGLLRRILGAFAIDRTVYLDHRLQSTNAFPLGLRSNADSEESMQLRISALVREVVKKYPDHAVVIRGLTLTHDEVLFGILAKAGFLPILSRVVYWFDGSSPAFGKARMCRSDEALVAKAPYVWRDDPAVFDDEVLKQCEQLYRSLYLDRHTFRNPRYTFQYLKQLRDSHEARFAGYFSEGKCVAFAAYTIRDDRMICPMVGHDTAIPTRTGVYRMLVWQILKIARENKVWLNYSSGADEFKMLRGAVQSTEYLMVHHSHLRTWRSLGYRLLALAMATFGRRALKQHCRIRETTRMA